MMLWFSVCLFLERGGASSNNYFFEDDVIIIRIYIIFISLFRFSIVI